MLVVTTIVRKRHSHSNGGKEDNGLGKDQKMRSDCVNILKVTVSWFFTQRNTLMRKRCRMPSPRISFWINKITRDLGYHCSLMAKEHLSASPGLPLLFKTKIQVNSKFSPTFYPEFKVFVHFSRFYKLSNITIITIFFSHDRLSQRYTSRSTLSKMNFIVISQC